MKINMKNLIVVSIVVIIFLVTIIICVKTFQNNQTTTIITDSMASVEESTTIASNPTSSNGEFEVEDDGVIMSVTNTNGNYISQVANITSSNNLIYGDGWVATQGYDPNEGKTTNTTNANTKPTVPEDIQNNNPVDIPKYTKRTSDKVKIEVIKDSISNKSVKILITDNNETPYGWGEYYTIQKKVNGKWLDIEYESNDVGWIEIAYALNENNQLTQTLDFENVYGILDSGIYRIGKCLDSITQLFAYSNEFEIK